MPRKCIFCTHEKRSELEQLLTTGKATQEWVAEQLQTSQSCVSDHMAKHYEKQVGQEAAPEYIRRAAKKKLDKIDLLRDLTARLQGRVKRLCALEDITPANENAIRATVGQFQLAIMNLAKLEGELQPEVQVNVNVQVKEQLIAMLNLLPADLRAQAYTILKEKTQV